MTIRLFCVNNFGRPTKIVLFKISCVRDLAQPVKIDLNKNSLPKEKTIQNFIIDAKWFRKTRSENPPAWEIGVTS